MPGARGRHPGSTTFGPLLCPNSATVLWRPRFHVRFLRRPSLLLGLPSQWLGWKANPQGPANSADSVGVPAFLLRKLYEKGSLRQVGERRFAFRLRNVLGDATLIGPPVIVVNGIGYRPDAVRAKVELSLITPMNPFLFRKGDKVRLGFDGTLLRGGNRIHILVPTAEFGELDIYVEDREPEFCEVPGSAEEE
jgi:hypothetical protein